MVFYGFQEIGFSWFSTDSKDSDRLGLTACGKSPLVAAGFLLLGFSAAPACKVGRLLPSLPRGLGPGCYLA